MKSRIAPLLAGLAALTLFLGGKAPDEGMWLPTSLESLPVRELHKRGLTLSPDEIFDERHTSLKDAVMLLDGGTASFISREGLILTNHHVAFSAIQSRSTLEHDYLKDGFWARTREEELPTRYTAQVVQNMRDVTAEILSTVRDSMSAEERAAAIKEKSASLAAKERTDSNHVCRVSAMYNGNRYYLTTYVEIRDVRLVYAPPSSIGNFGGEVDNWMWPRHTGDFSIMRAYVGRDGNPAPNGPANVPYNPRKFLAISIRGYAEGSFAMLLGFPGRTFRYREAAAVEAARDVIMPTTIGLYRTQMDAIEKGGAGDRAIQIKYASRLRRLANTYKNYVGTLEGLQRTDLVARKLNEEKDLDKYLHSTPELEKHYGSLLPRLRTADSAMGLFEEKRLMLRNLSFGVTLLNISDRVHAFISNQPKDSLGEPLPHPEKEISGLKEYIARTFRDYDESVDKQTLTGLILASASLPAGQQIRAFHDLLGASSEKDRAQDVRDFVNDLYSGSSLSSQEGCEDLLDRDSAAVAKDEGMKFAAAIRSEGLALRADSARMGAELEELRRDYVKEWLDWNKVRVRYPDANRTLRFTYGKVEGYSPKDAVVYKYATTLTGVMEKERSEDPFIVPAKLRALWETKDFGRYADPKLGDVPVAFLSNLDITGGNSGSAVLNGKGELIGLAFDGNWESVVGDYVFEERYDRTISVDARYILFILDKFSGAENVLKELVVR